MNQYSSVKCLSALRHCIENQRISIKTHMYLIYFMYPICMSVFLRGIQILCENAEKTIAQVFCAHPGNNKMCIR